MAEEKNKREIITVEVEGTDKEKTFTEELEVAGNQLVERVRDLIQQGNIRRLIIRTPEGRTLLEVPLTIGAGVGAALLFFNPLLVALGALGVVLSKVNVEIVREITDDEEPTV